MQTGVNNDWLPVQDAYPQVRQFFRAQSTFRYHLNRRDTNGLAAQDAVRMSPLGRLLVNPARVLSWAIGENSGNAA